MSKVKIFPTLTEAQIRKFIKYLPVEGQLPDNIKATKVKQFLSPDFKNIASVIQIIMDNGDKGLLKFSPMKALSFSELQEAELKQVRRLIMKYYGVNRKVNLDKK